MVRPSVSLGRAAEMCGVSVRTVHRMLRDGRLEPIGAPEGVRVSLRSIIQYEQGAARKHIGKREEKTAGEDRDEPACWMAVHDKGRLTAPFERL